MKLSELNQLFSDIANPEERPLKQGELLFEQGGPATHIYVVKNGCIRLVRYTLDGLPVPMFSARDGESFAEAAMFSEIYHCNAEAVIPSIILCYPKEQVRELFHNHPNKTEKFIALLTHQVRSLRTLLELRSIRSSHQRIFQYLLLHADFENLEVEIKGTFKELAHELGLAHETFYRSLADLEKEGKIQRSQSSIKIIKSAVI